MRIIVATLLLFTALSGCSGVEEATPEPLVGAEDIEGDAQGVLHVMAFADYGPTLEGARVSMLGTVFSARTDDAGIAAFPNVPAGTYTLRVEAERFFPVERAVSVGAAETQHEEVVLMRLDQSPDARTHAHNYWGQDTEVLIAQSVMPAVPRHQTDLFAWWPEGYNNVFNGVHRMNNNQTGEDPDYIFRVPVEETTPDDRPALVYPGTQRIEVTVAWDNDVMNNVEKMGVAYMRPESDELIVLERQGSGGTWAIPVGPDQADNGHQSFSFWNFFLYSGNDAMGNPTSEPVQWSFDEPFEVEIRVFKGELYEEPPHRDFWADGNTRSIRIESEQDIGTLTVRDWRNENSGHLFLPEDVMIPPGTTRMAIEYTYIHGDPDNNDDSGFLPQPQTLTFRTADQNPWETPVGEYRRASPESCDDAPERGECIRYELELEPTWMDAYYQTRSMWAFLTNVEGQEGERRYSQSAGGSITMILDIDLVGPGD